MTPAAVETRIFAQMSQTHIDFMLSKIPLARFGLPQEIAALVAWLCSEEIARFPQAQCSTFRAGARPTDRRRSQTRHAEAHGQFTP